MDVQVHHRLAGVGADVHADVVAVGMQLFVQEGFPLLEEGEEGDLLLARCVEEVGIKYPSSTKRPSDTWIYSDRQHYR